MFFVLIGLAGSQGGKVFVIVGSVMAPPLDCYFRLCVFPVGLEQAMAADRRSRRCHSPSNAGSPVRLCSPLISSPPPRRCGSLAFGGVFLNRNIRLHIAHACTRTYTTQTLGFPCQPHVSICILPSRPVLARFCQGQQPGDGRKLGQRRRRLREFL